MRFETAASRMALEREDRQSLSKRKLNWGVSYLDDATMGIFANDLVLLGAPPGVGKTDLALNIALTNILDGKHIHFIALEAHTFEIERRLKYKYFCNLFFTDPDRPRLSGPMNYKSWVLGVFSAELEKYMSETEKFCSEAYTDLFTLYKQKTFGVEELIEQVNFVSDETDLVIVDHAHYFDWDGDDNRALKEIVHTARDLTQETAKPIILVAHLRKRDKAQKELCPGMDDFHGSSELVKVATKCVTIAPGPATADGKFVTYFRVSKDRLDGGPTRFVGMTTFNPKKGKYDDDYKLAWANSENALPIDADYYPEWARFRPSGVRAPVNSRSQASAETRLGKSYSQRMPYAD